MSEPSFIYLASQSPRRQELLRQIGVHFELLAPEPHEDAEALERMRQGEAPADYVLRATLAKLAAARERLARRALAPAPILAADTTVALGGRLFAKPVDAADAVCMLRALSGRTHRVLTAVALGRARDRTEWRINVSRVTFARLSNAQIDRYVASGQCMDKAGAYGIQGSAGAFVKRIEGSYSGIMGLPLYETSQLLRQRVQTP